MLYEVNDWTGQRWKAGTRVTYRDVNLILDRRYHGEIKGFASANIALVLWDGANAEGRTEPVAEAIPNLKEEAL